MPRAAERVRLIVVLEVVDQLRAHRERGQSEETQTEGRTGDRSRPCANRRASHVPPSLQRPNVRAMDEAKQDLRQTSWQPPVPNSSSIMHPRADFVAVIEFPQAMHGSPG
jgi:hypothetical protein